MRENIRHHARRVKRCQDDAMELRWTARGMVAIEAQIRCVQGFRQLPACWSPSRPQPPTSPAQTPSTGVSQDGPKIRPSPRSRSPKFHDDRDIPFSMSLGAGTAPCG